MKSFLKSRVPILFAALLPALAPAQSSTNAPATGTEFSVEDNYRVGRREGTLNAGPMFSPLGNPQHRPTINYAVAEEQLGFMVSSPGEDGFFRGNLELVPSVFGAGIYDGPGNYIAGVTLWFRYNFVQRGWRVTPFLQLGGGSEEMDIEHSLVGENFNFNLDGAAGLRYYVSPKWTVNLEYRLQHLSNADLGPRNIGVNSSGPILGVSCMF